MEWNIHRDIPEGTHAFLGASKYSWLNYSEERLVEVYKNAIAKERGTKLHDFAKRCIDLKQRLPAAKKTLNMYVNDAISLKMRAEQPLKYSSFCFGTADAISFKKNHLRIHDLKTGKTPASLHQLEIYAALFCLEYGFIPSDLSGIELRIYQNDEIITENPGTEIIVPIMDKIVTFDRLLEQVKEDLEDE